MDRVMLKHLCIVMVALWFSVVDGKAIGHVVPQHSPLLLKTDGNNIEVYIDNGDGGSWLQMVLVFARHSDNNQSTPLIVNIPCIESDDGQTKHHPEIQTEIPEFTNTSAEDIVCKDGFTRLESNKCYFVNNIKQSFYDALEVCESMGTTLAYPMSEYENNILANYLQTNFKGMTSWFLGGSDEAKEGEWVWAHTKSPITFIPWSDHQPDNFEDNENCMHIMENWGYKWNDIPCISLYPSICQQ